MQDGVICRLENQIWAFWVSVSADSRTLFIATCFLRSFSTSWSLITKNFERCVLCCSCVSSCGSRKLKGLEGIGRLPILRVRLLMLFVSLKMWSESINRNWSAPFFKSTNMDPGTRLIHSKVVSSSKSFFAGSGRLIQI